MDGVWKHYFKRRKDEKTTGQVSEGTNMCMYAWNCYEIKWNNCGMGFICRMCLRPSSRL